MSMKRWVPTPEAYQLLHESQIALAEIESAGVRVDKGYLEGMIEFTKAKIRDIEESMKKDSVYLRWQRRYAEKTNIASPEQMAQVVFGELGYKAPKATASGDRASASESALESVADKVPMVVLYLRAQKLRKALGTYLYGIRREMVQHEDGLWYVHPNYNLNTVETFRSSCDNPNYQNIPTRNPEIGEMIRRCYIARPGHQLGELDYGQIEVRIPCAYNFDPTLISYVSDSSKDMHRDMAAQIFMLTAKQVSKDARSIVKNKMVFPTFYGSYYAQIAPSVWEAIDRQKLVVEGVTVEEWKKDKDGHDIKVSRPKTVKEHLAENGITRLGDCDPSKRPEPGTFEHHMKEIEEHFWGTRFKVYSEWKRNWLEAYYRDGGCRFLTGFIMCGPHKKNDIINYAIQGTAFHCTAWSMCRIVNAVRKYKMKSRVIGEVHDSINGDIHQRERDDYINLCHQIMTQDIKRWATWLNVPLVAEPEICPLGMSWHDKAALAHRDGVWVPADLAKWSKKYGPWEEQCAAS